MDKFGLNGKVYNWY